MKKIHLLFLLFLSTFSLASFSQSADSLSEDKGVKLVPAIKVGGNYTGFFTGEAGFLFTMSRKNSHRASTPLSTMCHGPALSVELGKPGDTLLIAPKFSYEYFSISYGARISVVDYMKGSQHNIYVSPEAGISFGAFMNLFAGASFPVSGEITEMSTFRLSLVFNLYTSIFKKG